MASKKFKFQNVILDHSRPLGSGSYGNTYQAHCDHLLCAGKHMTPELFESDRESTWGKSRGGKIKKSLISSFQHEIDSLRCICHPHLVQYLGTYIESDSQLPILLMELCRDNLTTYLDEWYESFVYHKQVSLLHDIALALVFLHTHGVVHGNLSSNNVFVVPYPVPLAKVSDYGICRMSSIAKHSTTYYRGNSAYLPPNPLACLQHNAARVDSYSWGILATQVLTQQLPLPPPKPLEQVGTGQAQGTEDHHKSVLALVDTSHPLLPIIKSALRQLDGHRPPSDVISYSLAELKAEKEYFDSIQREKRSKESSAKPSLEEELRKSRKEVERLTKELAMKTQTQPVVMPRYAQMDAEQKGKAIKRLSFQFHEDKKDDPLYMLGMSVFANTVGIDLPGKDGEEEASSHGFNDERQAGDGMTTSQTTATGGREMESVKGGGGVGGWGGGTTEDVPLRAKKREEVDGLTPILQTGSLGHTKKRRWSLLKKSSTLPDIQTASTPTPSLTVRVGTSALSAMIRGYSAVDGHGKAYFTPFSSSEKRIYSCKLNNHSKNLSWLVVPECPHFEFGLAIVNDAITAVGGYKQEYRPSQPTNCLLTYSEARGQWMERFPPMHTRRRLPAVVTTPSLLVVAGGNGNGNEVLTTVEVMNLQTQQWSAAGELPVPLTHASATLHKDCLHIAGGQSLDGPIQAHLTSSITRSTGAFVKEELSLWKKSYKTPTLWCTLTSLGGHLFAVGGQDDHKNCSSAIFMYDHKYDIWVKAGSMRHKRSACLVAVPCGADSAMMVVVGGFIRKNEATNAAEVISCTTN